MITLNVFTYCKGLFTPSESEKFKEIMTNIKKIFTSALAFVPSERVYARLSRTLGIEFTMNPSCLRTRSHQWSIHVGFFLNYFLTVFATI